MSEYVRPPEWRLRLRRMRWRWHTLVRCSWRGGCLRHVEPIAGHKRIDCPRCGRRWREDYVMPEITPKALRDMIKGYPDE